MQVELASPRYTLEQMTGGIRTLIPTRRNWFVILFLCVWLCGWFFGFTAAAGILLNPSQSDGAPDGFLLIWITGWTLGGAFAIVAVLWQLFGQEIISIEQGLMSHRVEVLGLGRTRSYMLDQVLHLRTVDYSHSMFTNQKLAYPPFFGAGIGPIAFDYGARTFRFAAALDEAEARMLVKQLVERLPNTLKYNQRKMAQPKPTQPHRTPRSSYENRQHRTHRTRHLPRGVVGKICQGR